MIKEGSGFFDRIRASASWANLIPHEAPLHYCIDTYSYYTQDIYKKSTRDLLQWI
jgi:hypothetical protein